MVCRAVMAPEIDCIAGLHQGWRWLWFTKPWSHHLWERLDTWLWFQ